MPNLNIFLSYSSLDSNYFQIPELAKRLQDFPTIKKVLFWDVDSGIDIVEYMEKSIETTDIFILFCSENSSKSKSVKNEWQAAYQLSNDGVLKIIPVFEEKVYVPVILRNWLYVEFKRDNVNGFVEELHREILR